jgi:hypothetical protein
MVAKRHSYDPADNFVCRVSWSCLLVLQVPCSADSIVWAGGFSPERSLSASLALIAATIECKFLCLEHQSVTSASECTADVELHGGAVAADLQRMFLSPPEPPDPALLARLHLRCGVGDLVPLTAGVHRVIAPMLRRFRDAATSKAKASEAQPEVASGRFPLWMFDKVCYAVEPP